MLAIAITASVFWSSPVVSARVVEPGAPAATRFCSTGPITISGSLGRGPASPYPSSISVAGMSGVVTSVSVTLNDLQHAWGRDLDVLLVGPSGEKFIIMSDVGQAAGFDAPATVSISDSAAIRFPNGFEPIPSGSYKPTNYNDAGNNGFLDPFAAPAPIGPYEQPGPQPVGSATFASVFNQANPNGVWSLYIMDDDSSNTGSVTNWCLDLETGPPAADNLHFASTNFNGGAGQLGTVTVDRTNPSSGSVSVSLQTADGTATGGASCAAGIDYISTGGTLTFAAGETSKSLQVQLCPDSTLEPNETIQLSISNPTGGSIIGSPRTATLTIIPQGSSASQFCNPNAINIPIANGGRAVPYPVTINVSGMTGVVNGVKLTLNNIQHAWASDLDVLLVSPSGRRFVAMSDVGEQLGFDSPRTITLTDEAAMDLLNVATPIPPGAYRPTNLDADDDDFPSPAPSAPYGQPFPFGRGTFANVFNNSDPNGAWTLFIADDGSAAGGSIAGACLDITSGAALPNTVQFTSANFNRADATTAAVTVHRPNTTAGAVSVNYATSNGTAIGGVSCDQPGVDYVSSSGTLSFADGEASKNISVELCAETSGEPNETLNITLSNPTGGAVIGSPGTATVTIYNGQLPCDLVWTRASSPHLVTGVRTVLANQVLCVEAGSTVSITGGGKLNVYGELRAIGSAADRITLTGGNRIEVAGTANIQSANIAVLLNVNSGGTLFVSDSSFGPRSAVMTFPGLNVSSGSKFVSLDNVIFDSDEPVQSENAQFYGRVTYLLMNNVSFKRGAFLNVGSSWSKLQNVSSENSRYEGMSFNSASVQPTLLENLTITNCMRAGLDLFDGDYFIGNNVLIQNCEYPMSGKGGLLPGSVLPTTGNRNNWIEVGQPGGNATYANVGLPYVVSGFATISGLEFHPGITLKGRSNFYFNTGGGIALRALGLPDAPVKFEPFDAGQKWGGGQYNSSGDRMEYVILDGMRDGVASPEGTGSSYYIDNSIIRNNTRGVVDMLESNGAAYLHSNLFTNNQTAIVAENARIQGGWRTNPNLFENNLVAVSSISVPDVRYAWWNSPTGPTTPANPGGTGDRINGGARFQPFRTTRPDTNDHPPVVRMPRPAWRSLYGPHEGFADAGKKIVIDWDASDDNAIVKQKILFSPNGNGKRNFTILADNLPPGQRSFELTIPSVGFVQGDSNQFIRVVAIDAKGQEGFADWQPVIPSGEIYGELTITADVAGRTFRPGDEIPFTYQVNSGFPSGSIERFIVFDADRKFLSYGANSIATMPPISTDTARLMIIYSRSLNQQKFFFSEPFSIRPETRFPDAAPQVSVSSPAEGQQFQAGAAIPIAWSSTDDEAIRFFNIQTSTDGGRSWIQIAENLPPSTSSFTWQPEIRSAIADVRVRVIAVDRRFQNSSMTRKVAFTEPANQSPSVQVTFPANGAVYTVGQSTFIAANASDPDGTIQRVEFYAKGGAFLPEGDPHFIGSDTTPPYQVPWVYPAAQDYVVTARAFDDKNRLVTSAPVSVTFNPFTPAPLPIGLPELTNPVDGSVFPAGADMTLEGLPFPTHRTIVRVEFFNGTTRVGIDTTAPYSITLNDVPAGRYTFFVKAVADNNAEAISPVTDVTVGNPAGSDRTPFDFDGDGKADISIFRPSGGIWYLLRSTAGFAATAWGLPSDVIVPADYDGDGKTDLAIFRRGENSSWYIFNSSDNTVRVGQWGASNPEQPLLFDTPVPADYDGDNKADLAVWRTTDDLSEPARFVILNSSDGTARFQQWGSTGDRPVPADFDGDSKADLAIYRSGAWWISRSSDGGHGVTQFGLAEDKTVPADYDADGRIDVAVYRPSTGVWYLLKSTEGFFASAFGLSADLPTPADYDGDGRADLAVYRDGQWHIFGSTAGYFTNQFGLAGDRPIANAFVR